MFRPRHGALYYVVDGEIFDHNGLIKGGKFDPTTKNLSLEDAELPPAAKEYLKGGVQATDYCRMFESERDGGLLSKEMLVELGDAMARTAEERGDDARVAAIPAAYTYFGQFVAHEMTRLDHVGAGGTNLVTPTLDLDSIFDRRQPNDGISIDENGRPQLRLGRTSEFRPGRPLLEDLPRNHPTSGAPQIADDRNDANTPLAQTHVAVMKFFNSVSKALNASERDIPMVKAAVIQHFQSVVLHDYLSWIIRPDVYEDVTSNGRAVFLSESGPRPCSGDFRLPIEFAMALRFGHSMVRDSYDHWTGELSGDLNTFWANTCSSNPQPDSFEYLKFEWVNNWLRILQFKGTRYGRDQVEFKRLYLPGVDENPLTAAPIDTRLAAALGDLPEQVAPREAAGMSDLPANLAARTLLRHGALHLKDARSMAGEACRRLECRGRPPFKVLSPAEIRDGEPCFGRLSLDAASKIAEHPPLWFYILREAKVLGQEGRYLGPLGSRILMETIHAAIEHSPNSILPRGSWTPDERLQPSRQGHYTLPDLIAFAGHPWPAWKAAQTSSTMIA